IPFREQDAQEADAGHAEYGITAIGRKRGGRKSAGNQHAVTAPPGRRCWITGRIPGLVPGPERGADMGRGAFEDKQPETPEPKGKLDTDGERTTGRDPPPGCH